MSQAFSHISRVTQKKQSKKKRTKKKEVKYFDCQVDALLWASGKVSEGWTLERVSQFGDDGYTVAVERWETK